MCIQQRVLAIGLMLAFAVCSADSLDPELAKSDAPRTVPELVRLCMSEDTDRLAYCEGYIVGAVYLWKAKTACESLARNDQLYCAGAKDAQSSIEEMLSECPDCDQTVEREKLRDELRAAGDLCTPGERRDEYYCAGYNASIEFVLANLLPFRTRDAREGARNAGLSHAVDDFILHLWASAEIHHFAPCTQFDVPPDDIRTVLLRFVRDYTRQTNDMTAVIGLAKALYYGLCPGPEQGLKPHMEACTTWDYENGKFGTRNACDKAVFVQFREEGRSLIETELKPGEALLTGRTREQKRRGWWMFSACPVGYVSLPAFTEANKEEIQASRYSCVPR